MGVCVGGRVPRDEMDFEYANFLQRLNAWRQRHCVRLPSAICHCDLVVSLIVVLLYLLPQTLCDALCFPHCSLEQV